MATWLDARDQAWQARLALSACTPHATVRLAVYALSSNAADRIGQYIGTLEVTGDDVSAAQRALDAGGMAVVDVPPRNGRPRRPTALHRRDIA